MRFSYQSLYTVGAILISPAISSLSLLDSYKAHVLKRLFFAYLILMWSKSK